jgi:DNA-binding transcriptional MerR regulator
VHTREAMPTSFTIGDFSRATHLTVKTLRHYHEMGLLEPTAVDPRTGYRRYSVDQIPVAQIIRRFRTLDMPLDTIREILGTQDVGQRNQLITAHLMRLEEQLKQTRAAVASLRRLLETPIPHLPIGQRRVGEAAAAAIQEVVDVKDALKWFPGALAELRAALQSQHLTPVGTPGGIFANALFTRGRGEATLFIPCGGTVRSVGRVRSLIVPAAELATLEHQGSHENIDLTYGALAAYVTEHALAVDGPLREYYIVGPLDAADENAWRTEVGWPIFQTS